MNRWENHPTALYRATVGLLATMRIFERDDELAAELAEDIETLSLYLEGWNTAKWGHR